MLYAYALLMFVNVLHGFRHEVVHSSESSKFEAEVVQEEQFSCCCYSLQFVVVR